MGTFCLKNVSPALVPESNKVGGTGTKRERALKEQIEGPQV